MTIGGLQMMSKNMMLQITINLPQILTWPVRPHKRVSVPNLKLFGPMKTELWVKEEVG